MNLKLPVYIIKQSFLTVELMNCSASCRQGVLTVWGNIISNNGSKELNKDCERLLRPVVKVDLVNMYDQVILSTDALYRGDVYKSKIVSFSLVVVDLWQRIEIEDFKEIRLYIYFD